MAVILLMWAINYFLTISIELIIMIALLAIKLRMIIIRLLMDRGERVQRVPDLSETETETESDSSQD